MKNIELYDYNTYVGAPSQEYLKSINFDYDFPHTFIESHGLKFKFVDEDEYKTLTYQKTTL